MKKYPNQPFKNKQHGFSILAVILVIVAVIVAIGVWALSGQTNTSNGANSTTNILVSSLIDDSANIKLAFDKLVINGANPSSIVFAPNVASTTKNPNILDPVNGIQASRVGENIVRAGHPAYEGIWLFNAQNFLGNNGNSVADPTIMVSGLTYEACVKLNETISGYSGVLAAGISRFNPNDATVANPNTSAFINFSFAPQYSGVTMGCFGSSQYDYVFFRILQFV